MNEYELRGRFLLRVYEGRKRRGGLTGISDIDFSGGEPVTPDEIMSVGRYLDQNGYIEWMPLMSGTVRLGDARITAAGIDIVELEERRPSNILFPPEAAAKAGVMPSPAFTWDQPGAGWGQSFWDAGNRVALEGRARAGAASVAGHVTVEPLPVAEAEKRQAQFTSIILARPMEISSFLRRVAGELRQQIAESRSRTPNDDTLDVFLAQLRFFETTAADLDRVADTIDKAVEKPEGNLPDRVLAGEAAKLFDRVAAKSAEFFKAYEHDLPGIYIKGGLFLAGCGLVYYFGIDKIVHEGFIAWALSNFGNKLPPKDDEKK